MKRIIVLDEYCRDIWRVGRCVMMLERKVSRCDDASKKGGCEASKGEGLKPSKDEGCEA